MKQSKPANETTVLKIKKRHAKIEAEAKKIHHAEEIIDKIIHSQMDVALKALLFNQSNAARLSKDPYETHLVHHIACNGDTLLLLDFAYRITKDDIDIIDPLTLVCTEEDYFTLPTTSLMIAAHRNHIWQFTYLLCEGASAEQTTHGNHRLGVDALINDEMELSPELTCVLDIMQKKRTLRTNKGAGTLLEAIHHRNLTAIVQNIDQGFWAENWEEAYEAIVVSCDSDPSNATEEDLFCEVVAKGEQMCQQKVIHCFLSRCEAQIYNDSPEMKESVHV